MGEPKPWRAEVLGELKLWGALIRESTGKKGRTSHRVAQVMESPSHEAG